MKTKSTTKVLKKIINYESWKKIKARQPWRLETRNYQPWRLKKSSSTMKVGNERLSIVRLKNIINREGQKQRIINHKGWKQKDCQPRRLERDSWIMKIWKRGSSTMKVGRRFINHKGWKQKTFNHDDGKKIHHEGWKQKIINKKVGNNDHQRWRLEIRVNNHEGCKQRDYQPWRSKKGSQATGL